ncbi:MAG: flagellar L-ring protein 1 [Methyloligella sp.]|nr:MAG: flagellar L-ring protein 1 [Methyloligella sp.]
MFRSMYKVKYKVKLQTCVKALLLALMAITSAGCSHFDKISEIGETPKLSAIESPKSKPGYKPVSMPMPEPEAVSYNPNSLWRNGSRSFFKDQRARKVGDIITVMIEITDKAEIDNESTRDRSGTTSAGIDALAGYKAVLQSILPNSADPTNLVNVNSSHSDKGSGTVDREETLTTKMAAVVMQELPNGNLVIEGRQEVRVNHEIREIIVAGVIRPEDVSSINTIDVSKIAEARVSYGGRGHITNVQAPRYGNQVLDILLPF